MVVHKNYNTGDEEDFTPILIQEQVTFGGIDLGEMYVLYQKGGESGELHIFNEEYDYNHSQYVLRYQELTGRRPNDD
jgi:hypothetical protein